MNTTSPEKDQPSPGSVARLDGHSLRGIAHPLRLKILGELRLNGPMTATALAQRLDVNTGATSYHLRKLAEYGFIEEQPRLSTGRERWWTAVHLSHSIGDASLGSVGNYDHSDSHAYMQALAQVYAEGIQHSVDGLTALPEQWQETLSMTDHIVSLTPEEANDLREALDKVLTTWSQQEEKPVRSRNSGNKMRVSVQVHILPRAPT